MLGGRALLAGIVHPLTGFNAKAKAVMGGQLRQDHGHPIDHKHQILNSMAMPTPLVIPTHYCSDYSLTKTQYLWFAHFSWVVSDFSGAYYQ
jgi:hypothetical protein